MGQNTESKQVHRHAENKEVLHSWYLHYKTSYGVYVFVTHTAKLCSGIGRTRTLSNDSGSTH